MKICKDYVGLACVDGSCPIANAEKYAEMCMDVRMTGYCYDPVELKED